MTNKSNIVCPHFDDAFNHRASIIVSKLPPTHPWKDLACLHCGFLCHSSTTQFYQHFVEYDHYYWIRTQTPIELYCCRCRDYQHSKKFDDMQKRDRQQTHLKINTKYLPLITSRNKVRNDCFNTRGMCNMGSTCFMNSVLQVLLHTQKFQVLLHDISTASCERTECYNIERSVTNGCVACEFHNLSQESTLELNKSPTTPISSLPSIVPAYLLYSIWTYAEYVAGYDQQDAHEFLIALIDGLDTHLRMYHPVRSNGQNHSSPRRNIAQINDTKLMREPNSWTNEVFSGVMRSVLACCHCGYRSFKQEPFLDLSLSLDISSKFDIPSSAPNIMQTNIHQGISSYSGRRSVSHGGITNVMEQQKTKKTKYEKKVKHGIKSNSVDLRDCLKEFTNQEVLGQLVDCEKCGQARESRKQLSINDAPSILVIHLKRFDPTTRLKLLVHINFPLRNLDLAPYMSPALGSMSPAGLMAKQLNGNPNPNPNPESLNEIKGQNDLQQSSLSTVTRRLHDMSPNTTNEITSQPIVGSQSSSSSSKSDVHSDYHLTLASASCDIKSDNLYDLYGVVCHSGSLHQGHYISYVLACTSNPPGRHNTHWLRCDDEKITVVSEETVSQSEAYLLFYKKLS